MEVELLFQRDDNIEFNWLNQNLGEWTNSLIGPHIKSTQSWSLACGHSYILIQNTSVHLL